MAKNKKKIMIFFNFFKKKFTPLSFLYGISTLKGFPRQKAILTTYMHFILSKKHDLSDFEKNRKCPHGNAVCRGGQGFAAEGAHLCLPQFPAWNQLYDLSCHRTGC